MIDRLKDFKDNHNIDHIPSKLAIAGMIGGIALYDITCPKGETISEGVDRLIDRHKLVTLGTIAITAAHLANVLPERVDPFHRLTSLKRFSKE